MAAADEPERQTAEETGMNKVAPLKEQIQHYEQRLAITREHLRRLEAGEEPAGA